MKIEIEDSNMEENQALGSVEPEKSFEEGSVEEDQEPVEESNFLESQEKEAILEAIILGSGEAVSISRLASAVHVEEGMISEILDSLRERYQSPEYGIELVNIAEDKFQFRTKQQFAEFVRRLKEERPRRLSRQALETLSIIAYRQPITRHDIETIRGVDATPTLKTLLEKKLVRIVGHKEAVGQPALFGTTERFLEVFGLRSLSELPTLRDLRDYDRDPGENESITN